MKKIIYFILALLMASYTVTAQQKIKIKNDTLHTALLIIDEQEFYFPGGKLPLVNPEAASENTAKVLKLFRDQKLPVIHIQHAGGSPIHKDVLPIPGERVITKEDANAFNGTDLLDYLKFLEVSRLIICGMQTHMCVEASTRAASDFGFKCIVVQDACATRDLKWGDHTVSAADVHASTLASLDRFYAKIVNTADLE